MPSESVCDGEKKSYNTKKTDENEKQALNFKKKKPTSSPFYYYMIVDRVFEF